MKAHDLTQKISDYVEDLAKLTDAAQISEKMQVWLESASKFHGYSWNNTVLIWAQNPKATRVAGYHDWLKKHKRYVRKGEKGIAILAPCFKKAPGEIEPSQMFFRVVHVFDVSQTEGEPMPDVPNWRTPGRQAELHEKLLAYAAKLGISVREAELKHGSQGTSAGGAIVLSPDAGTKTLIHELAHELLHQNQKARLGLSREQKELEAETVAYVVARHFELPDLNSPNYLALWDADGKKIRENLGRVSQCAASIIRAVEDTDVLETAKLN